tara:strand:+ start:130 stop:609 length:480 start_codon:yes stop_codon:yes gene_type:complete
MDNFDKINLEKMIKTNNVEDCTQEIRAKQHSDLIRQDVMILIKLKKDYFRLAKSNPNEFDRLCTSRCQFIFNKYTDIFNKVKKDEIDLNILFKFLDVLKEIEQGNLDQHEGAYKVGNLLKEMYIDSAIRKGDKLDKERAKDIPTKKPKKISYKEFKLIQ